MVTVTGRTVIIMAMMMMMVMMMVMMMIKMDLFVLMMRDRVLQRNEEAKYKT